MCNRRHCGAANPGCRRLSGGVFAYGCWAAITLLLAPVFADETSTRLRSLVDRAQAAEQHNRLDEAVALYEEILRIRPGWASAELNLGLVHHSRGEYGKAIQFLTNALRHNASLHSALLFRGASFYSTGRFDEAVRDLEQYLRHDVANPEALSYLANSHVATNNLLSASLAYAQLARITNAPSAYFQLADSYSQLARLTMARLSGNEGRLYRQRILAGEDAKTCDVPRDTMLTQARCAAVNAEFEKATKLLIEISERPKRTQEAIYWSVTAFRMLADAAVAKVFSLAPESTWAALLRAQSAEHSDKAEVAEAEYERAIAASEAGFESYVRFGQFQTEHGRFDKGLALYERALALEPHNPRVKGLIGELHALGDRPEEAVPFLETALKANPRETQTRLYLAQSLIKLSRIADAIQILEAAPEDPDGRIHYLLGRTYQQAGQPEKARRAMEIFRQRRKSDGLR